MKELAVQKCISCGAEYPSHEPIYSCRACGSLLEIKFPWLAETDGRSLASSWEHRSRTIWRFKELIPITGRVVSLMEGGTPIYLAEKAAKWAGVREIYIKFEGLNPTGSFKDRGMSVGVSKAVELGRKIVVCASTGNTSSSMSAYAAAAGLKAIVVVPKKGIAAGKLFQTVLHGAKTVQIAEGFDKALGSVLSKAVGSEVYILNSVNPWRIEGQKTLAFELWTDLKNTDYFVSVPVGNCGNISAIWKGFKELQTIDLIDRPPRLVAVQAEGASPFVDMVKKGENVLRPVENPTTIASAIRIGKPVNWMKALKAVRESEGLAEKVSDQLILEAQRILASEVGIGVEPASAASLAGVKKLVEKGLMDKSSTVVCVATGHALKDPNTEIISPYLSRRTLSLEELLKSV
ncbi:MAG: threonine synthase [Candidatus Caldarchaeum sp.]|nr:threonine synthase [Candidatus Caldarchaeum sp.]MDW8435237.1 threonine synthase [Candidatus Caldarchaeum sp.]